jgi:hypothetical protein
LFMNKSQSLESSIILSIFSGILYPLDLDNPITSHFSD